MLYVKVQNAKELAALLARSPAIAKKIIKKAVSDSAFLIQRNSSREAPADTGDLKDSIETDVSDLNNFRAEIAPKMEYAEFVHEGNELNGGMPYIHAKNKKVLAVKASRVSPRTRAKFAKRTSKKGFIIFGKKIKVAPPNRFMRRGKIKPEPRIKRIFEKARAEIIRKLTLKK